MHFPHAQSDFSPLCIQAIDQFDQRESSRSLVDDVMVKSFVHPSEIVNRTEGKSDGFVSGRVLNLKPRSRCYRNYSPLFSATIEWFVQDHRSQTRKWVFHSNEFVWICQQQQQQQPLPLMFRFLWLLVTQLAHKSHTRGCIIIWETKTMMEGEEGKGLESIGTWTWSRHGKSSGNVG